MNLVTKEDVLERLGLTDSDKITAAVNSAMSSVTPRFESVLQTKLSAGEYTEVFLVDPNIVYSMGGLYRLRLKNGFVREGSVTVYVESTLDDVIASTTAVTPTSVDLERGFVFLTAAVSENNYVRVEYQAGYEDETDDTIPDWLKDAAFYYFVKLLAVNQNEELTAEAEKIMRLSDVHSAEVLDGHLRSLPMSLSPIY